MSMVVDGTSSNLNVLKMPEIISLKTIYHNTVNIYLFSYICHLQTSQFIAVRIGCSY